MLVLLSSGKSEGKMELRGMFVTDISDAKRNVKIKLRETVPSRRGSTGFGKGLAAVQQVGILQ